MSRNRNWAFTINNWTPEELLACQELKCQYIIIGDEVGETGTPHLQGYVEFFDAHTMSAIKKYMPRAHLEIAYGNAEQNREYCTKEKFLYEGGAPKRQGKRNDIRRVRDQLDDGANMRSIVTTASSHQSIRMAEVYLSYHEQKRNWKPLVKWFYGPTGTGKSFTAYKELEDEDVYTAGDTARWWQGYDANSSVILDDFRSSFICFNNLLKLLDCYPYLVEVKGGSRQFLAKKIIITSPFHPKDVYKTNEEVEQLIRRIDEIREFRKN